MTAVLSTKAPWPQFFPRRLHDGGSFRKGLMTAVLSAQNTWRKFSATRSLVVATRTGGSWSDAARFLFAPVEKHNCAAFLDQRDPSSTKEPPVLVATRKNLVTENFVHIAFAARNAVIKPSRGVPPFWSLRRKNSILYGKNHRHEASGNKIWNCSVGRNIRRPRFRHFTCRYLCLAGWHPTIRCCHISWSCCFPKQRLRLRVLCISSRTECLGHQIRNPLPGLSSPICRLPRRSYEQTASAWSARSYTTILLASGWSAPSYTTRFRFNIQISDSEFRFRFQIQVQDSDFRFRFRIQISDSDFRFRFQNQISYSDFRFRF